MATGSSVLAQRIPGMGSLVGCRLWGRTELDATEVTQQQQWQLVPVLSYLIFLKFIIYIHIYCQGLPDLVKRKSRKQEDTAYLIKFKFQINDILR